MTMQQCNVCLETKDISCFEHQKNRPNPRKTCKSCRHKARDFEKEKLRHKEYSKKRRENFPDLVRQSYERSVYGVCKEDFQYKECCICGSTDQLNIDHDHVTGKARGLLCGPCNRGLGHFKDDVNLFKKAISYLKDGPHFQLPWNKYP